MLTVCFFHFSFYFLGATIHTENGLIISAKKRTKFSFTKTSASQMPSFETKERSASSHPVASALHRTHTSSELKFLVAAEIKTDDTSLSASKCPMGKFS